MRKIPVFSPAILPCNDAPMPVASGFMKIHIVIPDSVLVFASLIVLAVTAFSVIVAVG